METHMVIFNHRFKIHANLKKQNEQFVSKITNFELQNSLTDKPLCYFEFDIGKYANLITSQKISLKEGEIKPIVAKSLDKRFPNDLLKMSIIGQAN